MNTAFGQRRSARTAGMAERTPNFLASYEAAQTTERVPAPGNDDGLAVQLWIVPLLDGCVECVHVDVHDFAQWHVWTILDPAAEDRMNDVAYEATPRTQTHHL